MFFLVLFTLGIDSFFANVEVITAFIDGFAHICAIKKDMFIGWERYFLYASSYIPNGHIIR